jgi:hypothetical protein
MDTDQAQGSSKPMHPLLQHLQDTCHLETDEYLERYGGISKALQAEFKTKIHWVDPWRHGIIAGIPRDQVELVERYLGHFLACTRGKGIWWVAQGKGMYGAEFVTMSKVSPPPQRPWEWDGTTLLFESWQEQEAAQRAAARQFRMGDQVQFTHKGTTYQGVICGGRKKASVLVGHGKWGVPYSELRHA